MFSRSGTVNSPPMSTKNRDDFQMIDSLAGFKSALFIILINSYYYWFVHYSGATGEKIDRLILHSANIVDGKYWCFLTSGFVHLSWSHFIFNMLALRSSMTLETYHGSRVFGNPRGSERRLGRAFSVEN